MWTMMEPRIPERLQTVITAIHYACPALVTFYFLVALSATVCTLQTRKLRARDQRVRRDVLLALVSAVTLSYLLEAFVLALQIFINGKYPVQHQVIYVMASTIAFGVQCLALTDSKFPVWYPYYGTWFIGLAVELFLVVAPNLFDPPFEFFGFVILVNQVSRICGFMILPATYFELRNDKKRYEDSDVERQSLLDKKGKKAASEATLRGNGYGTNEEAESQDSDTADNRSDRSEDSYFEREREAQMKIDKRLERDGNWFTYAKGFTIFFPYLWPYHDKRMQLRAVLVGGCLLVTNALNVLVPNQMGIMVDSLTNFSGGDHTSRIWLPVAIYALLRFISGEACIGSLRYWLWLPLEQYSYDALSTASHAHLMSLSSDFHDSKSSSDLTQAIHGGRSVTELLEIVCFKVVPMFIDLAVAFAYLWALFGPYMGLIMVSTVISYLYVTTKMYSRKAECRRDYITIVRKEWSVGQQSLDGWNTASLFNMIPYEQRRYSDAVKDHMKSMRNYAMTSQTISAAQSAILVIGLLGALLLGVYQVAYQDQSVGKFTTLIIYWGQLISPLSFFGNMYKQISRSLMESERLLELFQTEPTIVDVPDAKPLELGKGVVKFENVSFAYDERKPTLTDVSFVVASGKTVALVGETGGGKSTILKLIDRFYEVKSGSILIDDQDVRQVTLDSLRGKIGVVPQDPMLFNDSIMNNIRYARLSATDQEVHEACKAAAVHDKILKFPDGYNSKVGDRGVKLSGGEKQRVAIARAILKQPEIILLDEATSAVDTETEQLIQEGFKTLCHDRTTFIVAHRLSTIMKADLILVVMNGKIVEQGSHEELIQSQGKYHDLWSKQIFVKPMNDRTRSRSPKKYENAIINDLTPSVRKVELAKALKTTHHGNDTRENDNPKESADGKKLDTDNPKDSADGRKSDTGKRAEDRRKRESSTLKPDAPEFFPNHSKPLPPTPVSKAGIKEAAKAQKSQEKDVKKLGKVAKREEKVTKKEEKKVSSLTRNAGKRAARHGGMDGNDSTAEDSHLASTSNYVEEVETAEAPLPKRARTNRRQHAKSEPAGSQSTTRLSHTLDGQQDSDLTGSGEGQPLLQQAAAMQRRRVSAPSDPPGQQAIRRPRTRRNRHWRLKNRTGSVASASGSNGASSGTSNDDAGHSHPAPPLPSPAAGAVAGARAPRVSFAMPVFEGNSTI
ncbi:hypothetical protein LZ554_004921 [Drepanopeziza brunnea f. sp. 'monogermtubi']|nr:hypothetical protein LZ554_004921 [Drepanopeziza brunnea f. sp. 'monogermtubi']